MLRRQLSKMPGAFVEEAMEKKRGPWYGDRKPKLPDCITFRVGGSLPQINPNGGPSHPQNSRIVRWIFWVQLIVNLVWLGVIIVSLPETRGSVILRRRVKKFQKETGDLLLIAVGDESRASIGTLIKTSTTRPLMLLLN